jgi:hypothetical protein
VSHLLRALETFNVLGIQFVSLAEQVDTSHLAQEIWTHNERRELQPPLALIKFSAKDSSAATASAGRASQSSLLQWLG